MGENDNTKPWFSQGEVHDSGQTKPLQMKIFGPTPSMFSEISLRKGKPDWGAISGKPRDLWQTCLEAFRSMSYTTKSKKIMSKLGFFPFRIFFFKNNKAGWFIAQRITLNNHRPFLTSLCNLAKLEEAELCFQWSSEELLSSPLKWATFQNPCNLDPYHGWVYSHITWAAFCPPYKQPVRVNWSLLKYAWLLSY